MAEHPLRDTSDITHARPQDPATGQFMSSATPEVDEEICELYVRVGLSLRQIARHIGRSKTFVVNRLKALEVPFRARGGGHSQHFNMDHKVVYLALGLYKRGWSMREISDAMECSIATTHRRLHMAGADVRTRSEAQRAKWSRRRELDTQRAAKRPRSYPPTALAA